MRPTVLKVIPPAFDMPRVSCDSAGQPELIWMNRSRAFDGLEGSLSNSFSQPATTDDMEFGRHSSPHCAELSHLQCGWNLGCMAKQHCRQESAHAFDPSPSQVSAQSPGTQPWSCCNLGVFRVAGMYIASCCRSSTADMKLHTIPVYNTFFL